jgi:hypothetical protein
MRTLTLPRVVLAITIGLMLGSVLGMVGEWVGWSRPVSIAVTAVVIVTAALLYSRVARHGYGPRPPRDRG